MKSFLIALTLMMTFCAFGCETAKQATTAGGEVIGKGADVIGGATEGAAEGYKGKDVTADNPYNR